MRLPQPVSPSQRLNCLALFSLTPTQQDANDTRESQANLRLINANGFPTLSRVHLLDHKNGRCTSSRAVGRTVNVDDTDYAMRISICVSVHFLDDIMMLEAFRLL